jgi:hypothetical protein
MALSKSGWENWLERIAACEVFDVPLDLKGYWTWLVDHCKSSAADIQESVIVDQFWDEVLNALESGAFGNTPSELRKLFHVLEHKRAKSPVSEHQTKAGAEQSFKAWKSYLLYFRPGPVIEMIRIFKRRSGGDLAISKNDLQHQMKTRSYWHHPKPHAALRQKFGGKTPLGCWCIKIDLHPLGLMRITDVEFDESFIQDAEQNTLFMADKWTDLRQGDLFTLIESLQSKRNEEED